ncbi:MAG: tRNA (adenosine(37)-N6)-dimethylallyltransferase MiaA [Clostridia bacterium]|nr:tRNA (adenosine(37)-N6)-dimethylallyltransferase MiaA [Clostridia bacterium]
MRPEIIIICGPTASGKSALSIELAKRLDTEIISADSLAIYKGLDIGTAKPSKDELCAVKHHLIDVCEPTDNFSVSDFESLALPIIEDLLSRGKIPIICGGTGFYINSILYKLSYGGSASNLEVREKFYKMAEELGAQSVYDELLKVDPKSCEKIHQNDLVRVIRALEIYYSTGKKKSEQNDKLCPRYTYLAVTPDIDRQALYNRIDYRVDKMIESGLLEEVKGLIDGGIDLNCQCMQGIGYKETYDAIVNDSYGDLAYQIKLNSRHYAKRQVTFFKKLDGIIKVPKDTNLAVEMILNIIDKE